MEIPMLKKLRNSHKKPHTAKQNAVWDFACSYSDGYRLSSTAMAFMSICAASARVRVAAESLPVG